MEDFDAFYDLIRTKRKCGMLNNEWDDFKRRVKDTKTESNYQQFCHLLLDNAEMQEHRKRKKDDITYIDKEDCSDEEKDPQYELFVRSLKEHGNSYVLESEKDVNSVFIKYEAESGSRNVSDQKSQQKMLTCAEQFKIAWFTQKSGPRNKWMGEHMCDPGDQAQSGEKKLTSQICIQQLDKGENVVVEDDRANKRVMVNEGDRCQKNNWLRQCPNAQVYHAQPVVKSEEQADRKLKRKKVVQGEQVYHARPVKEESKKQIERKLKGKNVVQGEQVYHTRPVKEESKKQIERKLKGKNVVQGEQVYHARPVKEESKKQIERKLKRKNVVQGEQVYHTRPVKEESKKEIERKLKGKNVVQGEQVYHARPVKEESKKQKNVVQGEQVYHARPVKEESKKEIERKLKGKNVVQGEQVYHAQPVKEESKKQIERKLKGKNVVQGEQVYHARPVKEESKKQIERKLKGKNVVQGEQVYHARPVKEESKKQIDRKLKGKKVVQGELVHHAQAVKEESKKQIEMRLKGKNVVQGQKAYHARSVREFKKRIDRKLKGKNAVQGEQVYHARPVQDSTKQIDSKLKGKNLVQGDNRLSNQKSPFGNYVVKSEPDDNITIRLDMEGTPNKTKNVKPANFPVTYNISDENCPGKKDSDEVDSEVEILDNAAVIEQGKFGPFVPSKRFHESMMDDNYRGILRPSVSNEFRKEVLKVISKPFDMDQYKRHTKRIEEGSYLDHYPDLGRKLKKHRYNREKRLAILRGFFFWLQNLTRVGSFQPWTDRQCLAVKLPLT